MKKIKRVGIDIAKNVFHVHGVNDSDQSVCVIKTVTVNKLTSVYGPASTS